MTYTPQYVSAYMGRWIINNTGSIENMVIVTFASSIQQCINQCIRFPIRNCILHHNTDLGIWLSKFLNITREYGNGKEIHVEMEMYEPKTKEKTIERSGENSVTQRGENGANGDMDTTANAVISLEQVSEDSSAQENGEGSGDSDHQALRAYESISTITEETMVAPGFGLFLNHLDNVFYFPHASSLGYFLWTALIQLVIQFCFDFVTVVVLRAQGVDLDGVRRRRSPHLFAVKVLIALVATQFTMFTYERHVSLLPRV